MMKRFSLPLLGDEVVTGRNWLDCHSPPPFGRDICRKGGGGGGKTLHPVSCTYMYNTVKSMYVLGFVAEHH